MREQCILLKHKPNATIPYGNIVLSMCIEPGLPCTFYAAIRRYAEASNHAQQGGFARARWPHQSEHFPVGAIDSRVQRYRSILGHSHNQTICTSVVNQTNRTNEPANQRARCTVCKNRCNLSQYKLGLLSGYFCYSASRHYADQMCPVFSTRMDVFIKTIGICCNRLNR